MGRVFADCLRSPPPIRFPKSPIATKTSGLAQATKVQTAGFGGTSPDAPSGSAYPTPGALHAHASGSPSQISLAIWPAFVLQNHLPFPVLWRTRRPWHSFEESETPPVRCPPGAEVPLDGYVGGGDTLALKLEPSNDSPVSLNSRVSIFHSTF